MPRLVPQAVGMSTQHIPCQKGRSKKVKQQNFYVKSCFSILVFFPFSFFDLCLCIVLFSYLSSQSFVAFGFLRIVGVFCLLLVYSLILVFSLITCCIVRKVMSFICSFSRLVIGVVMFMSKCLCSGVCVLPLRRDHTCSCCDRNVQMR